MISKQSAAEFVADKVKYGPENWATVVECVEKTLEYIAIELKSSELHAEALWGAVTRDDPAGMANSTYKE